MSISNHWICVGSEYRQIYQLIEKKNLVIITPGVSKSIWRISFIIVSLLVSNENIVIFVFIFFILKDQLNALNKENSHLKSKLKSLEHDLSKESDEKLKLTTINKEQEG